MTDEPTLLPTRPAPTTSDTPLVKLTKKGKPDKRSITSKQNINKAHSKVKEIVEKAKAKPKLPVIEEDDESSESDTEYSIRKVKHKVTQPDSDMELKMNELAKALDELSQQNKVLRNSFVKSHHLHKINSLSQNMLMKF